MYLHDGEGGWGFAFFDVVKDFDSHSLLSIKFVLPNGADIKRLKIVDWDILFIKKYLLNKWDDLDDRSTWSQNLTRWEEFELKILDKILR